MRLLSGFADNIRTQMVALLERFKVNSATSEVRTSWAVTTGLRRISLAFIEILPKNMRGRGEVDPDTARELDPAVNQMIQEVEHLLMALSESRKAR